MPRDPRGEALLNDERPATRRADGSRAFLGSLRCGDARRTRSSPAAQRARGEAAERRRSRPSTSARRIPLHNHRHPGDESISGRTHRAHRCITPQDDGDCGKGRASEPAPAGPGAYPRQPRRPSVATRRSGAATVGRTVRWVGSTGNVAHSVALDNPLQHSIHSGSDQGRATDATPVWTTGRARARRDQQQAQQTSRHTTPLQQPRFSEMLRAPSCSPKRTSGYVCHLGPRLERGGRRTTASHQSRHQTVAP